METQDSICAWAEETFGPAPSLARVLARTNEEMAEALRKITIEAPPAEIAEECADTLIVLSRAGLMCGLSVACGYEPANPKTNRQFVAEQGAAANIYIAIALQYAIQGEPPATSRNAMAQAWSALCNAVCGTGSTPQAEIDRKMEINRNRVWQRDGSGHGYHRRGEAAG